MTSTKFNVGLGESSRNSSKVLKPPGGGSSDIFGSSEPVQSASRRAHNAQMQSSVFGPSADQADTPSRNKSGNDSHNRLFGAVDPRPPSATKNRLKSNILFSSEESSSISSAGSKSPNANSSVDTQAMPRRNPVTGDGMYYRDSFRRSTRRKDGNPVTGEGYAAVNGEKESSAPASNNNPAPVNNATTHSAPPQRPRVPPGGFSSGLW